LATVNEKINCVEVPSEEEDEIDVVLNCSTPDAAFQPIALEFKAADGNETATEEDVLPVRPFKLNRGEQDENNGTLTTALTEIKLS